MAENDNPTESGDSQDGQQNVTPSSAQVPAQAQEPMQVQTPPSAQTPDQTPEVTPAATVDAPQAAVSTAPSEQPTQQLAPAHVEAEQVQADHAAAYATPGSAFSSAQVHPQTAPKKGSHSTGTLLAGLAVAALIGGIVGGGVSSLVVANLQPKSTNVAQQSGAVTLNNPDSVTEITGAAMVATPSVVTLDVQSQSAAGSGSGVIYSDDGYILTNAHVVTLDGAAEDVKIRVKLSDGRVFDGTVVGVAPYSDIAVVKIDADKLTPIEVADSSNVNVGDVAVAIGAPLNLANTVTSGVISALNRGISVGSPLIPQDPNAEDSPNEDAPDENAPDGGNPGFPWDFRFQNPGQEQENTQQSVGQVTLPVIQTDASINPGNSGGALLNKQGKLIGINVAIASPGAAEGTAASAGLGFAIPVELATRVADEIIAGEQPSHGLLGASVADSSFDTDADANHAGGLLQDINRDGAAAEAGLKAGDVITAVNGVPATDGTTVSALIRMHAGGSEITIDYTRAGEPDQVTVTLGTLEW